MSKVYIVSQGRRRISHCFGASDCYDSRHFVHVYSDKEKAVNHIKNNSVYRANVVADRYEQLLTITDIEESTVTVYAAHYDEKYTEELYYIYEPIDMD